MGKIELFYIGDAFYLKSSTFMSPIYMVGTYERYDWGFVNIALRDGHEVNIRPANYNEMEWAKRKLAEVILRNEE